MEETLKFFKEAIDFCEKCKGMRTPDKQLPHLRLALSALEKQTPKKPTHEATLYKCFTCPSCKNVIDEFETIGNEKCRVLVPHCRFCGQSLNWNEYE